VVDGVMSLSRSNLWGASDSTDRDSGWRHAAIASS
jgi:hypothetical protein